MPSLSELSAPGTPAPAAPAQEAPAALPAPFADIVAGTLPGVVIPPISKNVQPDPVQAFVVQNLDKLTAAGLDFYESKDLQTVVFNPEKLSEEKLAAADKAGNLAEVVTPAQVSPSVPADTQTPVAAPTAPSGLAALSAPSRPSAAQLRNVNPPQKSPIQPNPVPQQLARRAV